MSPMPRMRIARHPRAGFTLIEVVVVLLVVSVLGAMAWTLAQVGTSVHQRELRRADAERTRHNLEASAGRALAQTARGGVSAPNLGMLRVGVTNRGAAAADTLVLLRSTGAALPVASRPCRTAGGGLCVALRGDRAAEVRPGALLAVGSARAGYRLLQVASSDGPYTAPCGADCPAATFCAVGPAPGISVVEVLVGTRTSTGATAPSCSESFYPDGSRCVETRVTRTTSPRARSVCSATGAQALFTDVHAVDRTLAIGYPAPREWSALSGGGAPAIAAVPVEPLRLYPVPEGAELALYLQRGITAAGAWNGARRAAGPLASFRVESQHEGASAWGRGNGVDATALASSPNRVTNTIPGAGALGYTYARGYHTLVAVRLEVEVVGMDREGRRTTETLRILQSLAPLARGGAREEP